MDWVIAKSRELGYREMVADTMPQMETALAMYDRAGFERTGPYGDHPTPGAVYLNTARARFGLTPVTTVASPHGPSVLRVQVTAPSPPG